MILRCSCSHAFQDAKYGSGMRVHNSSLKGKAWRCTVCGTERGDDGTVSAGKKK